MSSCGRLLCRPLLKLMCRGTNIHKSHQQIRKSHAVNYRVGPPPHSKATTIGAEAVGALMWWWVLWHLWHESDHITGEFPYPDPSKWTNAELGIPPDNA